MAFGGYPGMASAAGATDFILRAIVVRTSGTPAIGVLTQTL